MNLTLKLSQLNGLIGDIFSGIGNAISNVLGAIVGGIFMLVYQILIVPLFLIIDAIQLLFRKFCGLDTFYVNGQAQSGDIVLSLINEPIVQNVFWSLLILAVILLIIVTIYSILRQETLPSTDKNRKTKKQVFTQSFKALLNFIIVPVVAIVGIFLGNAILKTLDGATSGGVNTRISGAVFRACAYECNRARNDKQFARDLAGGFNNMGVLHGTEDTIEAAVDEAFANFSTFESQNFELPAVDMFAKEGNYVYVITLNIFSVATVNVPRSCFSIYDAAQVFYYYDLTNFNFLVAIVASIFVLWVLLTTSIGLIKRMFKLTMLIIISPPIVAFSVLDDKIFSRWKSHFIKDTLSAYAVIVSLNLFFLLLGPIQQIKFFATDSYFADVRIAISCLNLLVQLLIVCGGLLFFKTFVKDLAEILGASNAYEEGGKVAEDTVKKVATAASLLSGGLGNMNAKRMLNKAAKGSGYKNSKDALAGADDAEEAVTTAQKDESAAQTQLNQEKFELAKLKNDPNATEAQIKAQEERVKQSEGALKEASLRTQVAKDESKKYDDFRKYKKMVKERFNQAKNSGLRLVTNGLSDTAEKVYNAETPKGGFTTVSDNERGEVNAAYRAYKAEKKAEKKAAKEKRKEEKEKRKKENESNKLADKIARDDLARHGAPTKEVQEGHEASYVDNIEEQSQSLTYTLPLGEINSDVSSYTDTTTKTHSVSVDGENLGNIKTSKMEFKQPSGPIELNATNVNVTDASIINKPGSEPLTPPTNSNLPPESSLTPTKPIKPEAPMQYKVTLDTSKDKQTVNANVNVTTHVDTSKLNEAIEKEVKKQAKEIKEQVGEDVKKSVEKEVDKALENVNKKK